MIESLSFKFYGRYGNNIVQLINALHIHLHRENSFLTISNSRKNNIRPQIIDKHNVYKKILHKVDMVFDHASFDVIGYEPRYINNIYYWNKNQRRYDVKYITFQERIQQLPILTQEILELDDDSLISDDDLVIHVRSTDIYKQHTCKSYAQPPIAFYHKVLADHRFNNIYIMSDNINNFVVNILKSTYYNKISIIEEPNTKKAFNILRNAKNVCTSTSSFCTMATMIKPTNRTKNIFTYEYLCYKPGVWHYNFMFDGILKRPSYNFVMYRINEYPFMQKIDNEFIGNWSFTSETQKIMETYNINNISRMLDYEYR